jgi:hypothetical protein
MRSGSSAKTTSSSDTPADKAAAKEKALVRAQLARQAKGKKVISIDIAALSGKGYPSPVSLDTGLPAPTPVPTPKAKAKKAP